MPSHVKSLKKLKIPQEDMNSVSLEWMLHKLSIYLYKFSVSPYWVLLDGEFFYSHLKSWLCIINNKIQFYV